MLQAHASYRGAAGTAMSGQSAPAFMIMHACLESSLYAFYLHRNPDKFEVWARRHEDEEAKRRVNNEFTVRGLKSCLEEADPNTADVVEGLYDDRPVL